MWSLLALRITTGNGIACVAVGFAFCWEMGDGGYVSALADDSTCIHYTSHKPRNYKEGPRNGWNP